MNQTERHLEYQWRKFTRNLENRGIAHVLKDLPVAQRISILEAFAARDRLQKAVRGKFGGIGARQTASYRGASIPFLDRSTRFMLPERPFAIIRRLLTRARRA